jgi:Tol biopolymer transport system component
VAARAGILPGAVGPRPATGFDEDRLFHTHNGPRASFNPSWSPGGKRITFTDALFPAGKPAIGDIWTVRPDGRGRQQVSHSPRFEFRPDWGH